MAKKKMKALAVIVIVVIFALFIGICSYNSPEKHLEELINLGQKYLLEGEYEQAIVAFTNAVNIDPRCLEAYIGMGDSYLGMEDKTESVAAALENYQMALELDGLNTRVYIGVADAYVRLGQIKEAIEILELGLGNAEDTKSISDRLAEVENMANDLNKEAERTAEDQKKSSDQNNTESDNAEIFTDEELPTGDNVIYADTEEELLEILENDVSDKIIVLSGVKYKISELKLVELSNVTIWGQKGTHIVSASGEEAVLYVGKCKGIILKNLTIGHDIPPDEGCDRGVLNIWDADLTLTGCDIFGCGKEGFSARDSMIRAENTMIRDCSDYIMELYGSEAIFENCIFSGNGYNGMWIQKFAIPSINSTLSFLNCNFERNRNPGFIGYDADEIDDAALTVEGCSFKRNGWE